MFLNKPSHKKIRSTNHTDHSSTCSRSLPKLHEGNPGHAAVRREPEPPRLANHQARHLRRHRPAIHQLHGAWHHDHYHIHTHDRPNRAHVRHREERGPLRAHLRRRHKHI